MRFYSNLNLLTGVLLFFSSIYANSADDNVVRLQGIAIKGNSAEPKVVYITPWQAPPGTGRLYQPVYSYRDHWLQPIDRASLAREMRYAERYLPKKVNQKRLEKLMQQAKK